MLLRCALSRCGLESESGKRTALACQSATCQLQWTLNHYLAQPIWKYPLRGCGDWASPCPAQGVMRSVAFAKGGLSTAARTILAAKVGHDGGET